MLIIVEGPDCAGKSSLIEELRRRIERRSANDVIHVLKCGPPVGHPLDEYVVPLLGYRPNDQINANHHVICDRLHWGEAVYPTIFKRDTLLDGAQWRYIESFLLSRGAFVVHLTAPVDVLERRLAVRGDDVVDASQLHVIRNGFYAIMHNTLLPHLVAEVDDYPEISILVDAIIANAETQAALAMSLNKFTTYVGPVKPHRLLLGDVRGPAFQGGDPINQIRPAFMPYSAMSGGYLWRALADASFEYFRDYGIGVANTCDVDNADELYATLGRPQVTTLGVNAYRCFKGMATQAPHPQWTRRFHHKRIDDYREQLLYGRPVAWN